MRTQPRMVHFHNNLQQFRLFNRVENWVTKSADRMSANRTFLKLGRHLNTTPDNLTYATIETIVLYNAGLIFFAPFNFVTSVVILRKYFGSKSNNENSSDDGGNSDNSDNSSNSGSNNSSDSNSNTASDNHNHGTNNVAIHPNATEKPTVSYDDHDTSRKSNGYKIEAKQLTIEFPNILGLPFENSKVTQIDFDYFGIKSENENENENDNSNDSNDNNNGNENSIRINHHNGKLNINSVFWQSRNDKNMNKIGNSNITASSGSSGAGSGGGAKLFDISQYPYEMASIFLSPLVSKIDSISNKSKKIDESLSSSIISTNLKNWSENVTVSSNYSISNKSDGKTRNVESKRVFDCYFNRFNTSRMRQNCINMASSLFGYMKDWNSNSHTNSYVCNNNSSMTRNNMNVTSNGSIIVNNYTKSYLNQMHNIVETRLRQNRQKKRNGSINPRKLLSMSAFERFKFEYFR